MTDFFKQLEPLINGIDVQINVRKKGEELTLSVVAKGATKDEAAKNIIPFIITGTAKELDELFFATILKPIEKTAALLTNMSAYEKASEKADAEKKEQKDAENKLTTEKKAKLGKHDKLVKKSQDLEKEKKYREALGALNEAKKFAEKPEKHDAKVKELTNLLVGGSGLFATESLEIPVTNYAAEIVDEPVKSEESKSEDVDTVEEEEEEEEQ
jgi:PRTRC genetic system protein E